MGNTIRDCENGDILQVADLLARAFESDPMLKYLTVRSKEPLFARNAYFRFCFHSTQIRLLTDDCRAAALWTLPGAKVSLAKQLTLVPTIIRKVDFVSVPRCVRAMVAMDQAHPKEPHYYLMAVGVDPESQGKGLGSQIINKTLVDCDRIGVPSYLDTSNPRNIPLYERLGFKVIAETRIAKDAPEFWSMWRAAKVD